MGKSLALGVVASLLGPAGQVPTLVDQLGSPLYQERESATRTLTEVGPVAVPALKTAARSTDPEVAHRAAITLAAIATATDRARTLEPTRVNLHFVNRPLSEVLSEFQTQTKFPLITSGLGSSLLKPVSIQTNGPRPAWEVLTQLQNEAGFGVGTDYVPSTLQSSDLAVMPLRGAGGRMPPSPGMRTVLVPGSKLILAAYTGLPRPGDDHSAIRIQALPVPASALRMPPGSVGVLLQATPEPRLTWDRVLGVRITRAVDDQDRNLNALTAPETAFSAPNPTAFGPRGMAEAQQIEMLRTGRIDPSAEPLSYIENMAQQLVVLAAPKPTTRALKHLEGVLKAQVLSQSETLVRVAPGAKAEGPTGVRLQGGAATPTLDALDESFEMSVSLRYNQSDIRIDGETSNPTETVWLQNGQQVMRQQMGGVVIINGRSLSGPVLKLAIQGLRVTDPTGLPYQIAVKHHRRELDQSTRWIQDDFKLYLKPAPGSGKIGPPAQIQFKARQSKMVEIPFRLRDVPLVPGAGS